MTDIGYHCSHEQIAPARLLDDVRHAEQAGFTAAMSSDHLSPWSARQGESGFAWCFLGAAMATTSLPFGVVNAPGQRYHPAIIAQAIATLSSMFPGRFWAALGSGEASNERVTGEQPVVTGTTYGSDLRQMIDAGIPTVLYGPGDASLAHGEDEEVPILQVHACRDTLAAWLRG